MFLRANGKKVLCILHQRHALVRALLCPCVMLLTVQDLKSGSIRHQSALFLFLREMERRFCRKDPFYRLLETFLGEDSFLVPFCHKPEILFHIPVKEEHITAVLNA